MPSVRPVLPANTLPGDTVGKGGSTLPGPVVAIGASTGGTEALRVLLQSLPDDAPPVLIVQHLPDGFTTPFARRLDAACRLSVREARSGDRLHPGLALIAPASRHLILRRTGADWSAALQDGPSVSRHRPSCDVLFASVAAVAGRRAIGVILTGMGNDGASGLRAMRDAGARTVGQDERTCIVFGMPRAAHQNGAVERLLPLPQIGPAILRLATMMD